MSKYLDFIRNTGYGEITGLKGVNCRHDFGAYFPGISTPPNEEELKKQQERDKEKTFYKWKDTRGVEHERYFTHREALDRQRDLERQMRTTRVRAKTFKSGNMEESYLENKARYRAQRAEYINFSNAMGIQPQFERVRMDGLGKI